MPENDNATDRNIHAGKRAARPGTAADLRAALAKQGTKLRRGDVVLIRTGRMALFDKPEEFIKDPPGLSPDGAAFLADAGAMIIGADNLSLETFPSQVAGDWVPVHTFLLGQKGIPIIEMAVLDELAKDLEHHHFKYAGFRRPGDVHVHFFGTATLSFSDGIRTQPGDVFEIAAAPFELPLRNPLAVADPVEVVVHAL